MKRITNLSLAVCLCVLIASCMKTEAEKETQSPFEGTWILEQVNYSENFSGEAIPEDSYMCFSLTFADTTCVIKSPEKEELSFRVHYEKYPWYLKEIDKAIYNSDTTYWGNINLLYLDERSENSYLMHTMIIDLTDDQLVIWGPPFYINNFQDYMPAVDGREGVESSIYRKVK